MPMHRWMQSAAGGTSQRLKPAFAIVCSRSRIPIPPLDTVPALLIVVITFSPMQHALAGYVCYFYVSRCLKFPDVPSPESARPRWPRANQGDDDTTRLP